MQKLIVVNTRGEERVIEGAEGVSLMAVMRDNGVDDLEALCGGACSCATCQVWVEPSFLAKLPPMSDQENDMLDCAENRRENSRLSCQIKMSGELDGMRVTVVPA